MNMNYIYDSYKEIIKFNSLINNRNNICIINLHSSTFNMIYDIFYRYRMFIQSFNVNFNKSLISESLLLKDFISFIKINLDMNKEIHNMNIQNYVFSYKYNKSVIY